MLTRLNTQINELTQLLALEKGGKQDLEDSARQSAGLALPAESERSRLQQLLDQGAGAGCRANAQLGAVSGELDAERQISQRAL